MESSDPELVSTLEEMADRLDVKLQGLRDDLADEAAKRDVRIRTNRRATWAALAVGAIGIIVGGVGIRQVHDANASRAQRTLAACLQANDQTDRSITAAEATSDDFIDYLGTAAKANPTTDAKKLQTFIDGAKAAQHTVIEKNYPKRDCSPAGIAAFYAPKH